MSRTWRDWALAFGWLVVAFGAIAAFCVLPWGRWYRAVFERPTTDPRELKIGELYMREITLGQELEATKKDLEACQARPRVNINYGVRK